MKVSKLWLGVGLCALAPLPDAALAAPRADLSVVAQPAPGVIFVAEGGESGEGGVSAEDADSDPVAWATALGVIAAHFQAGLAAYATGEQEAAAQMFAHGSSEIFAPMQEVFERRGAGAVGPALEAAVEAAVGKRPNAEIRQKGAAVLAALEAALAKGPEGAADPSTRVAATVELIDRAALQLRLATKDEPYEAYLDGLGFALAARDGAPAALDWLAGRDAEAAQKIHAALALALRAYPGARAPDPQPVGVAEMLAAASRAKAAIWSLPKK